jgi:hypothetical protein
MATKADFTAEEWEGLQKGLTGAGFLMAVSDRSFFDTFKEAKALSQHLVHARQASASDLVRELGETKGTGFGWKTSPAEVEAETLEALRKAVQTVKAKAPDETEAYKSFVLEVAESVGKAAAGGDEAEAASLEKIRSALSS